MYCGYALSRITNRRAGCRNPEAPPTATRIGARAFGRFASPLWLSPFAGINSAVGFLLLVLSHARRIDGNRKPGLALSGCEAYNCPWKHTGPVGAHSCWPILFASFLRAEQDSNADLFALLTGCVISATKLACDSKHPNRDPQRRLGEREVARLLLPCFWE